MRCLCVPNVSCEKLSLINFHLSLQEELSTRIDRKMAFMHEEQNRIQEEIDLNNELGKQV